MLFNSKFVVFKCLKYKLLKLIYKKNITLLKLFKN